MTSSTRCSDLCLQFHKGRILVPKNDRPSDKIPQFPYVSRPIVEKCSVHQPRREPECGAVLHLGRRATHSLLNQTRNLHAPLAERGNVDREHTEAVVKILAEGSCQ